MTRHYPIVVEKEESGAVSAYVPGLPIYAAADTRAKAERAIRNVLTAYLAAHPRTRSNAQVRVARERPTWRASSKNDDSTSRAVGALNQGNWFQ